MAKKFDFRLERVLRFRKQRQQQAELRQVAAQNQLSQARGEESDVLHEFAVAADVQGLEGRAFDPVALSNAMRHLAGIDVRLREARQKVARAREDFYQSQQECTRATTETEALKTLREQKFVEHRRKNEQEEQEAVDENVMRKWSRQESPDADASEEV